MCFEHVACVWWSRTGHSGVKGIIVEYRSVSMRFEVREREMKGIERGLYRAIEVLIEARANMNEMSIEASNNANNRHDSTWCDILRSFAIVLLWAILRGH